MDPVLFSSWITAGLNFPQRKILQVGATNAYVPCYVHMWVVEYVIEK
jgi:hypothetical protein